MGNLGITLAIGGTIVAMTLVIGMFALNTATTTAATSTMGILGHYTIKVMDSDGNMKAYVQTDNALTFLYRDCLLDSYLGSVLQTPPACTIGSPTIHIGDGLNGDAPTSADGGLVNDYGVAPNTSGTGAALINAAANVNAATGVAAAVELNNVAAAITITQRDLDASPNGGPGADPTNGTCTDIDGSADTLVDCAIDEVGLFDGGGNLLSHAAISPKVLVRSGDTVDVALTLSIVA